jgi:hypothetical protein
LVGVTLAAVGTFAGGHAAHGSGGIVLEPWQVINLVGAPLLAVIFVKPVIDDVRAWLASDRR